ncbi:MAG: hypothetical protein FWE34_03840 [Defluviitaleaceae bacterium]|nr:hypothetical protein [Defluviitaleaceae bacterium]
MSMPKFPSEALNISRDDAVNMILASIAMEELALSHILNAEGEKIQYVLGTLEGGSTPPEPPTIDQIMQVNSSVQKLLETTMYKTMFLKSKMGDALDSVIPSNNANNCAILTFNSPISVTQDLFGPPEYVPNPGDYGFVTVVSPGTSTTPINLVIFGDDIVYDPTSPYANQISSSNMIMPRSGVISGFAAQVYAYSDMSGQPDIDMTLSTTIYVSKDGGMTYKPALPSPLDFKPSITPAIVPMTLFETTSIPSGIINIPVSKGDRIMYVMGVKVNSSAGNGSLFTHNANFSIAIS